MICRCVGPGKKKRSRPVAELVFVATAPSRRARRSPMRLDHLSRKAPVRLAARGSYSAVLSGAARRHLELKREISYYSC